MKSRNIVTTLIAVAGVTAFTTTSADEIGHGDPINCAYSCADAGGSTDSESTDASLLDTLLDLLTLDEETETSE